MTPASSWLTRLRRPIAHARPAGPRGQRRGLAVPARVALIGATRFTRRRRRPIVWSCPGRPLGPTAASSKATGSGLGQAHQSRRRITGSDNRRSPRWLTRPIDPRLRPVSGASSKLGAWRTTARNSGRAAGPLVRRVNDGAGAVEWVDWPGSRRFVPGKPPTFRARHGVNRWIPRTNCAGKCRSNGLGRATRGRLNGLRRSQSGGYVRGLQWATFVAPSAAAGAHPPRVWVAGAGLSRPFG